MGYECIRSLPYDEPCLIYINHFLIETNSARFLKSRLSFGGRGCCGALLIYLSKYHFASFIFIANYNWMPSSKRAHASEYLVDLIAYLQGAFITFDSLPVSNMLHPNCASYFL